MHLACIILAIALKNIDIIFSLIGAITCSISTFLFPSFGMLVAYFNLSEQGHSEKKKSSDTKFYLVFAIIYWFLGLGIISTAIYYEIAKIKGDIHEKDEQSANISTPEEKDLLRP